MVINNKWYLTFSMSFICILKLNIHSLNIIFVFVISRNMKLQVTVLPASSDMRYVRNVCKFI